MLLYSRTNSWSVQPLGSFSCSRALASQGPPGQGSGVTANCSMPCIHIEKNFTNPIGRPRALLWLTSPLFPILGLLKLSTEELRDAFMSWSLWMTQIPHWSASRACSVMAATGQFWVCLKTVAWKAEPWCGCLIAKGSWACLSVHLINRAIKKPATAGCLSISGEDDGYERPSLTTAHY